MKYYIITIISWFLKLINVLVKKEQNKILFYPHFNCKNDGYDILNGESDNVLCLFNDIIRDNKYKNYRLSIVYYNKEALPEYKKYCSAFREYIEFVYYSDKFAVFKSFINSSLIFVDTTYTKFRYKTSKQKVVSLNYFGGMIKDDFYKWRNKGGYRRMIHELEANNRSFDYEVSIADISSALISVQDCFYYDKFITLGFPRNDIFFKDNSELRSKVNQYLGFTPKYIFCYAPTHRDYEKKADNTFKRTIFGDTSENELTLLNNLLEKTNSIIIAKIHPVQEQKVIKSTSSKRIVYFSELQKCVNTSLNPILAISDFLITDYTTTVYDYLYTERPIIYYFYDYDDYISNRGFCINPIQSICAGPIAYSFNELLTNIMELTYGEDQYREKRALLSKIFIKYCDGRSTERIKDFFIK